MKGLIRHVPPAVHVIIAATLGNLMWVCSLCGGSLALNTGKDHNAIGATLVLTLALALLIVAIAATVWAFISAKTHTKLELTWHVAKALLASLCQWLSDQLVNGSEVSLRTTDTHGGLLVIQLVWYVFTCTLASALLLGLFVSYYQVIRSFRLRLRAAHSS